MTMLSGPARDIALQALARPSGAFAMVAVDQRESLRTLLRETSGGPSNDEDLVAFKLSVIRALSAHASAILLDPDYALLPATTERALSPGCGLIVSADRLVQEPGGPVTGTQLDDSVVELAMSAGAVALKLLVLWHPSGGEEERGQLVSRFVDVCQNAGLISVLEGVVRPDVGADAEPGWLHSDGVLECAGELARHGPDLYKGEVPTLGLGSPDEIEALSRRMTAVVGRPWVVLSSGVPPERFGAAVEASCRGGASGFLAGRAIWSAALPASERAAQLAEAAGRLDRLGLAVDRQARPWNALAADGSAVR